MTTSKFRSASRQGHLDRMKRIYGYLCKYQYYKIFFRVDELDCLNVPTIKDYDWDHTVYGKHKEDIPADAPPPIGKRIVLTHFFDPSIMYDALSGKAMTGVCIFYNNTPVDWYCKQ